MTEGRLYHLALEEFHEARGAQFEQVAEWRLPASYGDPRAEHRAIRTSAAAADRSDRSRFIVSGTDALPVLSAALAGHIDELEEGRAMRTARLDEQGKVRDLLLVGRIGGIAYQLAGEPSQRDSTRAALEAAAGTDFDVRVDDRTETTCTIAIVGPGAPGVVTEHLAEALPPRLPALHVAAFEFHGFRATAVRTSDTGEDGFEFTVAPAVGLHLLELLTTAGVPLAGTAARDSARVEACIPAYTPELETGLTPAQADIDILFDVAGGDEGAILTALLIDGEGTLPPGTAVIHDGKPAGDVRSCVEAYSLDAVAALAVIDQQQALPGTSLTVGGRVATVVAKPLYRRR